MPQVGCACAVCTSTDPRDTRLRTGALLEAGGRTLLIDSPPELRLQLLRAGVRAVDGVLYTHGHADHVNGIDDLRIFSVKQRAHVPLFGPPATLEHLRTSFDYIFNPAVQAVTGTSKPMLTLTPLTPGTWQDVLGVPVLPIAFAHGPMTVYGYRVGDLAYVTDVQAVPQEGRALLAGVRALVLNALWWRPHPTHLSIPEAIEVARAVGAERTYLTHLSHETGHAELAARLPPGIEPAWDGLILEA
ncbi:MAG: MBL fold metallo-hydrolase [Gemmatimonadales bacterium]|nr:MBL fold metallo-hydrolase [Gemmatimonadales bacterium]